MVTDYTGDIYIFIIKNSKSHYKSKNYNARSLKFTPNSSNVFFFKLFEFVLFNIILYEKEII